MSAQLAGVSDLAQSESLGLLVFGEYISSQQAVEGGLGVVETAFDLDPATIVGGENDFLGQAHDGLEEVVVAPHVVIELVEKDGLRDGIETVVAEIGPDEGIVFLLDETVVILVPGARARKLQVFDLVAPEADQVVIEELAAVVGVNFDDREGQVGPKCGEKRLA